MAQHPHRHGSPTTFTGCLDRQVFGRLPRFGGRHDTIHRAPPIIELQEGVGHNTATTIIINAEALTVGITLKAEHCLFGELVVRYVSYVQAPTTNGLALNTKYKGVLPYLTAKLACCRL